MSTSVYLSTGAFKTRSLKAIVEFSLEQGLSHIELSSGVKYEPDFLEPVYASSGQPIRYLVHNYFPTPAEPFVLNLAASDEKTLENSLTLGKTAIDLAADLGAPFYSIHSGFAVNLTPELLGDPVAQAQLSQSAYIAYDQAYEQFVNAVKTLTDYAKSRGIRLLIENNVVSPLYLNKHGHNPFLMAAADEIVCLMQDVNDSALGLLVDVGHANVSATALGFDRLAFLETVAPYIGGFHLSDNDGQTDQNLPFDQQAWFYPFLKDFPTTTLVIEVYRLTIDQMRSQYQVLEDLNS